MERTILRGLFTVVLLLGFGHGIQSCLAASPASQLPAVPTGLKATASSSSSILLTWNLVSHASGYLIERSLDGISYFPTYSATNNTFTDTHLISDTNYHYQICATNAAGNSTYTDAVSATTKAITNIPNPPTLQAIVLGQMGVKLIWNNVPNANKYELQSKSDAKGSSPVTIYKDIRSTYDDLTPLSNNASRSYKVRYSSNNPYNPNYSSPLTVNALNFKQGVLIIGKGGTYTNENWQNTDPNQPATVQISTSDPVTIVNSNFICGTSKPCIAPINNAVLKLTVKNSTFQGMNPNVPFAKQQYPAEFLDTSTQPKSGGFSYVDMENNFMEGVSGSTLYYFKGITSIPNPPPKTPPPTVIFRYNQVRNVDGRYSNGNGKFSNVCDSNDNHWLLLQQFYAPYMDIAWNEVISAPGNSCSEDVIDVYASGGVSGSPLTIHNNYIDGAYPANLSQGSGYSGGGIMSGDGCTTGSQWIETSFNSVLSTTNYGLATSDGKDVLIHDNRAFQSGVFPNNGSPDAGSSMTYPSGSVGIYSNNLGKPNPGMVGPGDYVHDNLVGWVNTNPGYNGRNNYWVGVEQVNANIVQCPTWQGTECFNTITTMENNEHGLWLGAVDANSIALGPQSNN